MVFAVCHSSGQWKWRCHLSDSPKNIVIYGIKVARDNCSRKQICIENYIKINVSNNICLSYRAVLFCVQSIWRGFFWLFVDSLPHLNQRWVITLAGSCPECGELHCSSSRSLSVSCAPGPSTASMQPLEKDPSAWQMLPLEHLSHYYYYPIISVQQPLNIKELTKRQTGAELQPTLGTAVL